MALILLAASGCVAAPARQAELPPQPAQPLEITVWKQWSGRNCKLLFTLTNTHPTPVKVAVGFLVFDADENTVDSGAVSFDPTLPGEETSQTWQIRESCDALDTLTLTENADLFAQGARSSFLQLRW